MVQTSDDVFESYRPSLLNWIDSNSSLYGTEAKLADNTSLQSTGKHVYVNNCYTMFPFFQSFAELNRLLNQLHQLLIMKIISIR